MMVKPVVIRFIAPTNEVTINNLTNVIDQKIREGARDFTILISSPGGLVNHGITAYNYLRSLPATVTTHNIGSVDSVALILYCAGSKRLSTPHARFIFHEVMRLRALRSENEIMAKIISTNSNKSEEEIMDAMRRGVILSVEEARAWGLIHGIEAKLFEEGSEIIGIPPGQVGRA